MRRTNGMGGLADVYGEWSDPDGNASGGYSYEDPPWWAGTVSQAIDVFGNRGRGSTPRGGYPPDYYPAQAPAARGGLSLGGNATGQGLALSWPLLVGGGLLIGAFLFGRKGR